MCYNFIGDKMILKTKDKNIPVKTCIRFKDRFIGLMFKKNIKIGYLFPRCNSIHTFFMKEKIDVLLLDKNNKIIQIYKSLSPNRIILPKRKVYSVLELPNNTSEIFKINEKIKIS